jgi:hypothetical protein
VKVRTTADIRKEKTGPWSFRPQNVYAFEDQIEAVQLFKELGASRRWPITRRPLTDALRLRRKSVLAFVAQTSAVRRGGAGDEGADHQ